MLFDPNDLDTDFFLYREGPIVVTCDRAIWENGIKWLVNARGFKRHHWTLNTEEAFYDEVSETLSWKEQFGYERWNGNLDALNDGASACEFTEGQRILISIDNADRLKNWFGQRTANIWDIFKDASRMQLIFGVGLLLIVYSKSNEEVEEWSKVDRVFELRANEFLGGQLARNASKL